MAREIKLGVYIYNSNSYFYQSSLSFPSESPGIDLYHYIISEFLQY